jgi:ribosomal-protein-alanine N-acetyltransferase
MSILIETQRLQLKPCHIEDILQVHQLWTNEQIRYYLFDNRIISLAEAQTFIADSLSNFEQYGYGIWLVFLQKHNHLVGFAGFLGTEEAVPSLIYGIAPDFWGNGYGTESAQAVLCYALEKLSLPKVIADVDEPNLASVRVLQKLGMKETKRAVISGNPLLYFEYKRQN